MAKKIYLSPSDQAGNLYATGDTNEKAQCRRISDACEAALRRCGFEVINDQQRDMKGRVAYSNSWGADMHVPIHTNAFDGKVMGTRIFYTEAGTKSQQAANAIFSVLAPITPGKSENVKPYPALYELRMSNAVAVYVEVEFHDAPAGARWIIDNAQTAGETIARGICDFYNVAYVPAPPAVIYRIQVGAFRNKEYAESFLQTVREDFPQAFMVTAEL